MWAKGEIELRVSLNKSLSSTLGELLNWDDLSNLSPIGVRGPNLYIPHSDHSLDPATPRQGPDSGLLVFFSHDQP